jgi:hypothetical protein
LNAEEQQKFLSLPPLQDPYDLTPTRELFQHLDMIWAAFGATGQFKPVKTIASALSWRPDYEDFDRFRKTPNHPSTLTPSIVRGVAYTAAGWSLSSFQRNDPLTADYIDYMLSSTETPDAVKSELRGLDSNPAFKKAGRTIIDPHYRVHPCLARFAKSSPTIFHHIFLVPPSQTMHQDRCETPSTMQHRELCPFPETAPVALFDKSHRNSDHPPLEKPRQTFQICAADFAES